MRSCVYTSEVSSIEPVINSSRSGGGVRNNSEFDEDDDLREYLRTARQEHRRNTDFSQVHTCTLQISVMYRAGRLICRKVLKIMFWDVPPADWLIL